MSHDTPPPAATGDVTIEGAEQTPEGDVLVPMRAVVRLPRRTPG